MLLVARHVSCDATPEEGKKERKEKKKKDVSNPKTVTPSIVLLSTANNRHPCG